MRQTVLFAAMVWLSGCGDMLYAEVEVEELCQEAANQEFEASPAGVNITIDRDFEYPFDLGLDAVEGFSGEAQLKHMILRPADGLAQLDFIDAAQVELSGPENSGLPPLKVVDFVKGSPSADGSVTLSGDEQNVMPYLESGMVKLKTLITGTLPTTAWKANVQTCMFVKARYPYMNALSR